MNIQSTAMLNQRQSRGFALIVSLLILVVLTLVAVTGLRSSLIEEQVSGNQKQSATALFGAEQGVADALAGFFDGSISDQGKETDVTWKHQGTINVNNTGYVTNYEVSHLTTGGSAVEDDDGRRYFLINSTGETTAGDARRMLEVAVALEWGGDSNVAGLIGCQGVTGKSNVVTGSYSSSGRPSNGDRGDISTTDYEAFMFLDGSSDMDIVGEVRSTGALWLKSDALVRRDALAPISITVEDGEIRGSAYTNGKYSGGKRKVKGTIHQGSSVVPNPVVELTDCDPLDITSIFAGASSIIGANNNGSGGMPGAGTNYSGSPRDIPGGKYWLRNFTLDGKNATIQGDVEIYLTGDFELNSNARLRFDPGASLTLYIHSGRFLMDSNSQANNGGLPINFKVYSRAVNTVKDEKDWTKGEPNVWDDGDAKVRIDSNSIFYGMMYAPRAHVVLYSNAEIYGSCRGRFVTTDSNLEFMYDEDLDTLYGGSVTDYEMVYWTELYPE